MKTSGRTPGLLMPLCLDLSYSGELVVAPPPLQLFSDVMTSHPWGNICNEPGAHDTSMCQGAVPGRAESTLRSLDASALSN